MKQALVIVLDSVGIGGAADAHEYYNGDKPDTGSDTLGHCLQWATKNGLSPAELLPNLKSWGLFHAYAARHGIGSLPDGITTDFDPIASWGFAHMQSKGKDTTTGHWEICGCLITDAWQAFPDQTSSVQTTFLEELARRTKVPGFIGNQRASGTDIIRQLGHQHCENRMPIVYTSADSVIQFAAHEEAFGLERLYELCQSARELWDLGDDPILGRVIARPFIGNAIDGFKRTSNRRDYAITPPRSCLLNHLVAQGITVTAIGKISDIFAHQGISERIPASSNQTVCDAIEKVLHNASEKHSFIFANLNDFDTLFGHRRDVASYFNALREFDRILPNLARSATGPIIICADHGNDPTWVGTDHTRECIPILLHHSSIPPYALGARSTLADIGQSICNYFDIPALDTGLSFLSK